MSGSKVKEKTDKKSADTYAGLHNSTQTFGSIGLLEAVAGDVVLRGRGGERDHIYPLHRAINRYFETTRMVTAMAKHAIRGWDTLMDINKELKEKIIEAIDQRRSLNREITKDEADFYEKFHVQH